MAETQATLLSQTLNCKMPDGERCGGNQAIIQEREKFLWSMIFENLK